MGKRAAACINSLTPNTSAMLDCNAFIIFVLKYFVVAETECPVVFVAEPCRTSVNCQLESAFERWST